MKQINDFTKVCHERHAMTFVVVRGLFTCSDTYERQLKEIGSFRCVFIDPTQCEYHTSETILDNICEQVAETLKQINITQAIFIGDGIGAAIIFKLGLMRPDWFLGQVLIGAHNREMDKGLLGVRLATFKYISNNTFNSHARKLLVSPLLHPTFTKHESRDELLEICEKIDIEKLCVLFEGIYSKSNFSLKELQDNMIPNYILTPSANEEISREDVKRFSEQVGTNYGIHVEKDSASNIDVIFGNTFKSLIQRLSMNNDDLKSESMLKPQFGAGNWYWSFSNDSYLHNPHGAGMNQQLNNERFYTSGSKHFSPA